MWQVEVGEAITGSEFYVAKVEKSGYSHSWGRGGKSYVPSAV
jgi:hypothetical protein